MLLKTLKICLVGFIGFIRLNSFVLAGERMTIEREFYLPAAGEDAAQWCTVYYWDAGLTRLETHRTSAKSDTYLDFKQRFSTDNGNTWQPFEKLPSVVQNLPGGGMVTYPGGIFYDAKLKIRYELIMRRMWPGLPAYTFNWGGEHPFVNFTFVVENGREIQMKYETGPDYHPETPFDSTWCAFNRAYRGTNLEIAPDGTAYFPMVCYRHGDAYSFQKGGVVLMRRETNGNWLASNQIYISPERSSRGVLEPAVAILKNGTILVVCRGSNTETTPGRKWFTISTDGGKTLAPIREFKYHDGTSFYSPSSIHHFIRSSRNGKLYWITNIVPKPPKGNRPRYPLVIAEIDEEKVTVKKGSVVIIEDRRENEPEKIQFSNFSVIENRETLDFELYMTHLGKNAEHPWQAPVYKYILSPPEGRH